MPAKEKMDTRLFFKNFNLVKCPLVMCIIGMSNWSYQYN